ncbi:inositol 1,4,5-triphosphate receptor associated 2-like isoform X2 [Oculina patagonica]
MMDSTGPEKEDPSKISDDPDAILDNLFYDCDKDNTGRVSVSKLIEYLRNAISSGTEEFAGSLDDLSLILDPDGRDMEIDLTSFQEGIKEWITEIRRQSYVNAEDECHSPVAVNCMDSPESRSYGSPKRYSHVTSTPNGSSDSVEGLGGQSSDRDWDSELIQTIETLQLNNKRLIEQQNAIQAQMESTEEANTQLTAEVESLRKQLRSSQMVIERSKGKDSENTELRQAVADALEANQCLQTKIAQLEKERASYESNVNEIEEKLLETQTQIELLEEERKRLISDLAEQKESSTNSSMIAGLSSANEALKSEKSRLQNRIFELEDKVLRLKRDELSAAKSQLVQNGPGLTSTPFRRQSSLQQELQAQETSETKGLPSPMVGGEFNWNDSLDVDDVDISFTDMNQSWMSGVSMDSTSTTATFEKYSITATQLANEFNEKKEKALRQIDELAALDKSVDKETQREHLTQELDTFADKVSSLCMKKKAAEKRNMKLLANVKKLKEENKQFFEERSKAYQKLGTMSLCNDEMSGRMLELEGKHEQDMKTLTQQSEKLAFLENQLSAVTADLFKTRDEKESLTRSLENEKLLSSTLEDELVKLRKSQDELESQQTLLLVRIKELESELVKTTSQLSMEKRRTSTLEESVQLSVSRHSDELKEIFDAIPNTDTEVLNRSRQSPRCSSPCITGHMVRTKLYDYVSQSDTSRRMQGVGRDSPDGKPVNELEEKIHPTYQEVTKTHQTEEPVESWLHNGLYKRRSSSLSSDSLSPKSGRHEVDGTSESPSGNFLQLVDNIDRELITSSSQTDLKDFVTTASQTDLIREIEKLEKEISVADKATITDEDTHSRRRKSGVTESQVPDIRTIEKENTPDEESASKPTAEDPGKLSPAVEKERSATNLWRKKLSVAFKIPDEFDSYESATGMALESSVGSSNFVDGVSLRVRPAPNEKEIEKQFKTLVLAFQTDQDTLHRRLEIQARARDLAETNMNKELQSMSNVLKEFEQLCFTKDMQDMLAVLKSQVEVIKKSSRRVSTQTEQHGCVQQEARMASGVEVMISHAENLTRHLERVREDLNELRQKERLAADEPVTPRTLANGPTSLDSHRVGGPSSSHPHQSEAEGDGTKQNSLLNFVMAFHTTSMRAKDALRSFRRRTEASRQEREASRVTPPQVEEPPVVKTDASLTESTSEAESNDTPVVLVSGSEEERDNKSAPEHTEEGQGQNEEVDVPVDHPSASPGLDEVVESSENESEGGELESDVISVQATPKRPGICWRCLSAAFRFTISFIILLVIFLVGITILDRHSSLMIDRYFILSRIRKLLEPVGQVIYYLKPPE